MDAVMKFDKAAAGRIAATYTTPDVVEQRRPSYQYREDVRVGAVLPEEGVTYYDVPPEYGVRDYRYTVVNGRTVLVEPRTHRIVEVVE